MPWQFVTVKLTNISLSVMFKTGYCAFPVTKKGPFSFSCVLENPYLSLSLKRFVLGAVSLSPPTNALHSNWPGFWRPRIC